jgi:predicted AlkP superfamily pyrophosphatase or phosphodiesterase
MKKLALLALLVSAIPASLAGDAPKERHVVLVSIDALRPEFYLSDRYETPTLKALAAHGASARAVESVYPSVTYPSHASIVTGVRPARHGILANTVFDEHGGEPEWLWETRFLKAKPIWQAAEEQGKKVAIVMWPTTVGAKVHWCVPERWGVRGESTRDLLLKHSTPGLLIEIALALGVSSIDSTTLQDGAKIDEFIAKAAAHVLAAKKPDLLLVHLPQVDHYAHRHGRDAPEVKEAVARTDANIARIRDAAKEAGILDTTDFVIVGDHGFTDVKQTVAPDTLLVKAGLVELDEQGNIKSWKALGHAHGGSMAVYARDEASLDAARAALEKGVEESHHAYRILESREVEKFGADPKAAFWLEAGEDWGIASSVRGDFVWPKHELRGTHGGLPTRPQLYTGFIASGPGVRHCVVEHMRLIDEAPTVAKLMGVELPDTDGGVLDVLDDEPY